VTRCSQTNEKIAAPLTDAKGTLATTLTNFFIMAPTEGEKDKAKVHKLSLKGSAKLVAEFVCHCPVGIAPHTSTAG
jgi:hypothetical protein